MFDSTTRLDRPSKAYSNERPSRTCKDFGVRCGGIRAAMPRVWALPLEFLIFRARASGGRPQGSYFVAGCSLIRASPGLQVRGSGFSNPRECSATPIQGFSPGGGHPIPSTETPMTMQTVPVSRSSPLRGILPNVSVVVLVSPGLKPLRCEVKRSRGLRKPASPDLKSGAGTADPNTAKCLLPANSAAPKM